MFDDRVCEQPPRIFESALLRVVLFSKRVLACESARDCSRVCAFSRARKINCACFRVLVSVRERASERGWENVLKSASSESDCQ